MPTFKGANNPISKRVATRQREEYHDAAASTTEAPKKSQKANPSPKAQEAPKAPAENPQATSNQEEPSAPETEITVTREADNA